MYYLNLGCGSHFHPDWINIDIVAMDPRVTVHDLRRNIPYADNSCEVVYHSHVLEHFPRLVALNFIRECYRVLKPGGIIRVVVPDLESIARHYLSELEKVEDGVRAAEANYDWMMLELYDQTVRTFSGGEMGLALARPEVRRDPFVRDRFGVEIAAYEPPPRTVASAPKRHALKNMDWSSLMHRGRLRLIRSVVRILGGKGVQAALDEGLFRQSGELHLWMYDRFSLRRLLSKAGFVDIALCRADESRIVDFGSYQLDVIDGQVRKPDSLFMEARKPQ